MKRLPLILAALLVIPACAHSRISFYEHASEELKANFKRVGFPLPSGTKTVVSQGAFGDYSHNEKGNEYNWDLDVPYGTPVIAVENGVVLEF